MKKEENFFKKKKTTASFALASLIVGFFFIGRGGITGNAILNTQYPISILSIIGIGLILCSAVLAIYSIRK